ncbi:MAG: ABC transporter substrate-binding protein [Planctomycetota bacterium]
MKLSYVLLTIVALLLLVQIIDRAREPEQMGELNRSLQQNTAVFEQLLAQQRELTRQQARLLDSLQNARIASATEPGERPVAEGDGAETLPAAQRDGVPRPGINFLKPLDFSRYDPDKVRGTLRSFGDDVPGINNILTSYAGTSALHDLITESLASQTALEPNLWTEGCATSCIANEDFTEFTFTIRPGVRWQVPPLAREPEFEWLREAPELTAHDFVFALEIITHPQVENPHQKPYYEALDSFEAIDDQTLVIRWSESQYTNISFSLGLQPLPRHIYGRRQDGSELGSDELPIVFNQHWFDERLQAVGVGRYRLEDYIPKQGYEFVRNSDYFGVPDHFERRFWDSAVQKPDAQLVAFKNNQVHYHGLIPSQYKAEVLDQHEPRFAPAVAGQPQAGRDGPFGWERVGSNRWYGIAWNCRRPQLADMRVRQALGHAFPFERVLREVLFGLGQRCDGPIHPESPYHNDNVDVFEYDPDKARALLEEAGWTDTDGDGWRDKEIDGERRPLRIRVTYYGLFRAMANLLAQYQDACRDIGVDLAGDPVEDREWSERSDNRNYDGFVVVWSSGLQVDFKQLWHGSTVDEPKSSNLAQWSNPEADVLIEQLRTEFDQRKRYELARRVQAIIYREQPYLFASVAQGVFIWQHLPYGDQDERELLDGVTWALDHAHPLFSRAPEYWWLRDLEP